MSNGQVELFKERGDTGCAIIKYNIDSSEGQSGSPLVSGYIDLEQSNMHDMDDTKIPEIIGVHHGIVNGFGIGTVVTK
jgi:hypothetical protein